MSEYLIASLGACVLGVVFLFLSVYCIDPCLEYSRNGKPILSFLYGLLACILAVLSLFILLGTITFYLMYLMEITQ